MTTLEEQINGIGIKARKASRILARADTVTKNEALNAMADKVMASEAAILKANGEDVRKAGSDGLNSAVIDRLKLDGKRLQKMANEIRNVARLEDPVGKILTEWTRPNGLRISKVRVPIGVIGIIYESRPNVTSDAAVLCAKAGNATILRGGSESIHSNIVIADALREGAVAAGLPEDSVQLIPITDREAVKQMAMMDKYIDLIIPRGGPALIETVVQHARMPVIKHFHGVCIAYVDKDADLDMAASIVVNAKVQRPGVCNAIETLLVHREIAPQFFARTGPVLLDKKVEIRGDGEVSRLMDGKVKLVEEADWTREYLDLILAVRVVDSFEQAVEHIETYGSHHSDCIITENENTAERFFSDVDSATVYWNASTRFTDGAEFGFGAEIGISTDKLHARGPMALEELTSYKYVIRGTGQIKT